MDQELWKNLLEDVDAAAADAAGGGHSADGSTFPRQMTSWPLC